MTTRWILLALLLTASMFVQPRGSRANDAAPGTKSETTALSLSLFGTGLPFAAAPLAGGGTGAGIVLGGAVFGPSLGHFYAGRPGRALLGIGIRSASVVALAVAIGNAWEHESGGAAALGIGSVIVGTASMITDIAEAPRSARIHNGKLAEHRVSVAPWATRHAAGLRASVGF